MHIVPSIHFVPQNETSNGTYNNGNALFKQKFYCLSRKILHRIIFFHGFRFLCTIDRKTVPKVHIYGSGGSPVSVDIIFLPRHTVHNSNKAVTTLPVGVTLPSPSQIGQRCQALLARNVSGGNAALALSSISCHEPVKRSFSMCQSTVLKAQKTNTTNPAKHTNSSGSFTSFAAQPTVFSTGF